MERLWIMDPGNLGQTACQGGQRLSIQPEWTGNRIIRSTLDCDTIRVPPNGCRSVINGRVLSYKRQRAVLSWLDNAVF